jgi:hypothetical protein
VKGNAIKLPDPNCVVKVGDGRGFVVLHRVRVPPCTSPATTVTVNGKTERIPTRRFPAAVIEKRLIVTATHCLPHKPRPGHAALDEFELIYKDLLATLDGEKRDVWASCRFVDPVSDVAILGCPDELPDRAEAYEALTEGAPYLQIGRPQSGTGWVLTLGGRWICSKIEAHYGIGPGYLWNDFADGGMSGSPILNRFGRAVGVVSVGNISERTASDERKCGPHPILVDSLPGWMLTS